jgi:hypothetical protein
VELQREPYNPMMTMPQQRRQKVKSDIQEMERRKKLAEEQRQQQQKQQERKQR